MDTVQIAGLPFTTFLLLALSGSVADAAGSAPGAATPPHIVYIVSDDQGW